MQSLGMASEVIRIRPRERRGDRTRARLVDAALEEFREHGFEQASIARIAQVAGVSRPTFYFHFPKKEDLLRDLLNGLEDDVADRVRSARGLREVLELLVGTVLEVQQQVGPTVFAEMLRAQTRVADTDEERSTAVLDAMVPLFREGEKTGELRPGLEPERGAALFMSSLFGCLLDSERTGAPDDLRALASLFLLDPLQGTSP